MPILDDLKAQFGDKILASGDRLGEPTVRVAPGDWVAVASWLKGEQGFSMFVDLHGVHWPQRPEPFDAVALVRNPQTMDLVRIKCATAESVPTLTGVWAGADWCEREAFDLFGIRFEGHPNLKRIYMPDDYPLHPMRKDVTLDGVQANATYDQEFEAFPQPGTQGDTTDKRNLG